MNAGSSTSETIESAEAPKDNSAEATENNSAEATKPTEPTDPSDNNSTDKTSEPADNNSTAEPAEPADNNSTSDPAEATDPSEPSNPADPSDPAGESGKVIYFASLPDIFPLVGKTLEELGYTEDDISEHLYLLLETDFLGQKQEVRAFLERWNNFKVSNLFFVCTQPISEAEEYFAELYGEPYLTGQEPYVESNGGVVFWSEYWTGEGTITLSKGDKNDYFQFSYYPVAEEDKPQEIVKREQGMSLLEFAYATGYYMDLTREDFDYLKIEEKEEGHFVWVFTYQGVDAQFDLFKNQGENLPDYLSDVDYKKSSTEYEKIYTYAEDGRGELILANIFGDVWKITMNEGASAEKLDEIRSFLEKHSWDKN